MKFIRYVGAIALLMSCSLSFAKSAHVITAKDIGRHGYVIKCPGQYYLAEDVIYNPCESNPAIRISASAGGNVTLDLKGKTLSQKSKEVLYIDGVVIEPGLTNVIVKNGAIIDFSDAAIRAGAVSAGSASPLSQPKESFVNRWKNRKNRSNLLKQMQAQAANRDKRTLTADQLVTELEINGIRAFNNGPTNPLVIVDPLAIGDGAGGVVILNAQDVNVSNCDLNENIFAGLWGLNITKFTMKNCHCDDTTAAIYQPMLPLCLGAALSGGSDIAIHETTFNRSSSSIWASGLYIDFFDSSTATNILIDSCQANDTNVTVSNPTVALLQGFGYVSGIEIDNGTNATINNCEVNGSSLTIEKNSPLSTVYPGFLNATINGIVIFNDLNVTVTNCSAFGQTFQNNSNVGTGISNASIESFLGDGLSIANCHAHGNLSIDNNIPALLVTDGFDFAAIGNTVIEDCSASGHKQAASNPPGQFSYVGGFKVEFFQAPSTPFGPVVLRRCVATGNMDTGTLNGVAFGFSTREETSPTLAGVSGPFVFESCVAEGNTNNSGTGSGFDLFNLVDSKVINCFAESNNIGINVTDFAPFASNDNIISDNVLSANTAFGIQDLSAGMSNAYYSNSAKNNGPTPAITNYSGALFPAAACPPTCPPPSIPGTPVLFWQLPGAPCSLNSNCVAPTNLDNLSIVN